ncbi:MAG: Gfo/Idh/MocA family oxidoreductase [Acidobacteriia bacterium]|nr:Gfo/Idh/MocA family oxidoreductase [Terriglobia bacterium]
MNRRTFIQSSAIAMASGMTARGANDRINVAVVGLRGRGRDHITSYSQLPEARIAAVCDIDQAQIERAVQFTEKLTGAKPQNTYQDIRKVLENKDIDAISIATCNHWHALATIWACQAGKDVYVEKPASHEIWEGRKMVEAARKHGRMVQVGMQSRTTEHKIRAMQLLHEGAIGKVYLARGLCYKRRKSIGHQPDGPVPAGVDYNVWLGPAPMRPFNPNRFHYNWHWFWDTGNGDIGNQGVHEMDIARWGLNKPTLPDTVTCEGGKFVYDDDQETPNTELAIFKYADCELQFEVRGLLTGGEGNVNYAADNNGFVGNLFYGSEGWMSVDLHGFQIYLGEDRKLAQEMKHVEPEEWATTPHIGNFLKAVRSRNQKDLTCDIEEGYLSAALCHMANISYRTGRKLQFDPKAERFVNDAEANSYITRNYRRPFVVPENV